MKQKVQAMQAGMAGLPPGAPGGAPGGPPPVPGGVQAPQPGNPAGPGRQLPHGQGPATDNFPNV
jgi:hypothetical protein